MVRRTHTPPCEQQCFITAHADGEKVMTGCSCPGGGWQYTDDSDTRRLEDCAPEDIWNDPRSIIAYHEDVGRGPDDPILCDCDDLSIICAACAKYESWVASGCPMVNGLPRDVGPEVALCISKPPESNVAHAFMLGSAKPIEGEPVIFVDGLYVFDPAGRWGMRRPGSDFYTNNKNIRGIYPLRFADLAGR